jgi:phage-related protein
LSAEFDTPYARGIPTTVSVGAGVHTITLFNKSDIIDGYTYPIVTFTGGSVDIVNTTDDSQRHFTFSGLAPSEIVKVDNEVKYISSNIGGEKLSSFTSKNWLRLRQGANVLTITATGDVTITCPHYAMIGL